MQRSASNNRSPRIQISKARLLDRLHWLLYEFHDVGRFRQALPFILWLMEIAAETESDDSKRASKRRQT